MAEIKHLRYRVQLQISQTSYPRWRSSISIAIVIVAIALVGCGRSSAPSTNNEIYGTWETKRIDTEMGPILMQLQFARNGEVTQTIYSAIKTDVIISEHIESYTLIEKVIKFQQLFGGVSMEVDIDRSVRKLVLSKDGQVAYTLYLHPESD